MGLASKLIALLVMERHLAYAYPAGVAKEVARDAAHDAVTQTLTRSVWTASSGRTPEVPWHRLPGFAQQVG